MKKIISTILLATFIIPNLGVANLANAKEISSKAVVEEKAEIYPIPYPTYSLHLAYPNGGEVLDRNQVQTIKWMLASTNPRDTENYPCKEGEMCIAWPQLPYVKEISIDLYRRIAYKGECLEGEIDGTIKSGKCPGVERKIFVKHIAFANIGDNYYSWKIDNDIPDGKDYIIRISTEPYIYPTVKEENVVTPGERVDYPISVPVPGYLWDESDGTFTITGAITVPVPPVPPTPNLKAIIEALQKIVVELTKIIALLSGMTISQ